MWPPYGFWLWLCEDDGSSVTPTQIVVVLFVSEIR